jgi:prepilin peptidase CpaA
MNNDRQKGGDFVKIPAGTVDVFLVVTLLVCCYTDLKERKIRNVVLFPAALLALILHILLEGGAGALLWIKGLGAGIGLFLIPFALGGIGAGDVKLLGVVGSFKGAVFAFHAFIYTALIGAVLILFFLWRKKELWPTMVRIGRAIKLFFYSGFRLWDLEEENKAVAVPYGLAITLGSFVCLAGEFLC